MNKDNEKIEKSPSTHAAENQEKSQSQRDQKRDDAAKQSYLSGETDLDEGTTDSDNTNN
jgi:hypothetical protein